MKPLLVGEANPYSATPKHALLPWPRGASGDRLARILGMSDVQYMAAFDRVDLLHLKPGERWSVVKAREAANKLRRASHMILLGRKVAEAFGYTSPQWSVMQHLDLVLNGKEQHQVVLLPHPSGRNQVWREPWAELRARNLVLPLVPR